MFQRVQIEEWYSIFKLVGFVLFFLIFLLIVIRTFLISRKKIERTASLPLQEEKSRPAHAEKEKKD